MLVDSVAQDTNGFINFLSLVLRLKERDTIITMLTILSDPTNAQCILCLRSLSVEICKTPPTCLNGRELSSRCPNGRDSIVCLHGPISTSTDSFSESSYSYDHLLRAWRHPHSSSISCLGFIMTMVMVISFVSERKTVPNDYALN